MPAEIRSSPATAPSARRIIAILVVTAVVLALVTAFSLANTMARSRPELALRLDPFHARAHAEEAGRLIGDGGARPALDRVGAHALAALRNTPLAPQATRALAMTMRGEDRRAEKLMTYAEAMSRRDLLTNLWMIERSVSKGDVNGALDRYDIALRSSRTSQKILFPILAGALAQPSYLAPITRIAYRQPRWLPAFVEFAISRPGAAPNLSRVLHGMPIASPPGQNLEQSLVDALIREQKYAAALRYASSRDPALRRAGPGLRDGQFRQTGGLTPFAWLYVSDSLYGAQRGQEGATFYGSGAASGIALGQLLMLSPGNYMVSTVGSISGGTAQWTVDCAPPSTVRLGTLPLGSAGGAIRIPAQGCRAQYLRLSIQASDTAGALEGRVQRVSIDVATR